MKYVPHLTIIIIIIIYIFRSVKLWWTMDGAASAVTVLLIELSGFQIPVEAVDISLTKNVQTVFCAQSAS